MALAVNSRCPAVNWHSTRWSPDFPRYHQIPQLSDQLPQYTLLDSRSKNNVGKLFHGDPPIQFRHVRAVVGEIFGNDIRENRPEIIGVHGLLREDHVAVAAAAQKVVRDYAVFRIRI